MADTNFSDGITVVQASWLNDVNDAIYSALGSGGVAPTTPTEVATNIGAVTAGSIHTGSSVTTPNDADELPILDSTSIFSLKKITWANIKSTLKTYFDTLYQAAGSYVTISDIGSTVQAYDDDIPTVAASQVEMEAGTEAGLRSMSPLRIAQAITALAPAGSDEKIKVSSNDTTAGYLNGKLVAGSNITLTEGSDGGNETLTIAASSGGGSISASRYTLYEDFHSAMVRQTNTAGTANWFLPDSGLMMLNGTALSMTNMFNFVDATSSQTYTNPRQPGKQSFYLAGTSTVGGATLLGVTFSQSGTTQTAAIYAPYKASKNPTFALRQVQLSATAATRILGLADSVATTPTNGIWFRYAASGNFILVCRSGGVESTVDTGVASDTSTIRKLEFRVTGGGTSVQAYVDDVAKGSAITTNIPSANLGLFLNNGYTGASAGVGAELYELELSIDK